MSGEKEKTALSSLVVDLLPKSVHIVDAEMGSHLITMGMLNLQHNQGHILVLNQKPGGSNIVVSGKDKVSVKGGLTR